MTSWPTTAGELQATQLQIAALADREERWTPPAGPIAIGGTFFASGTRDERRAWVAAVVLGEGREIASALERGETEAPYLPGLLALREGPLLERTVRALEPSPDVLLVNATGRDHPRRAGLALHLGEVLGLPTVGVTDRALVAAPSEPGPDRGDVAPLAIDHEPVGYVVRTRRGARAVLAHAAWRTDAETASAVVLAAAGRARTPEPIRRARQLARVHRARDEGRVPTR